MKKSIIFVLLILATIFMASCNFTNNFGSEGNTPFSVKPTHVEFYNGGLKIAEYDNAIVNVSSVLNLRLAGNSVTWIYYEVYVNGEVVDTIIDSEALCIKYSGEQKK